VNARNHSRRIQEQLVRVLELPDDVVYDLPKITLIGDIQFYIENHRGIIEYSPTVVRISVSIGEVEVRGELLTIRTMTRDELYLAERIQAVIYQRQGVSYELAVRSYRVFGNYPFWS